MVWQKYLAVLTGSEAKSLSLVIAIFLLGLATGYYVFGLWTEKKNHSRFLLLKYYGYVELLTGLYIGFFPIYFNFLKAISFNSPPLLIIDIISSFLALFLPTFLMGASIPMLTACLPSSAKEVNKVHAKVYGWNTLGACLGALLSGFFLIPVLGLNFSLHFLGLLNVIISLIFIGNRLAGDIIKQDKPVLISSPFPNSFFYAFVFFTGSLAISFEVFFVRILNLSIGAGAYNFPIILSIFVGALALGSLSIKKQKVNLNFFVHQTFIVFLFINIICFTAPYWSIWLNTIRVSLTTLPSNYPVYFALIFLFLIVFIFPPIFFMGRLLPLSYMFLKKTEKDYGKLCGYLYFFNTLGTVFGAVVVGYLAFYVFNLDQLFKINLYVFMLLILGLVFVQKNPVNYFIASALALILLMQPDHWNRNGHEQGFFRTRAYTPKLHFKGLFSIPKVTDPGMSTSFFKDGPNTTVTLIESAVLPAPRPQLDTLLEMFSTPVEEFSSYSIIVNGKSDGNSLGDFSTVFFMLPYLHSQEKENLSTAFVGLGTGLSAGAFTPLPDVKSIDVLEISPFVIRAISQVNPKLNFNVIYHDKTNMIKTDAFKYFTKANKKYDIVISEPSNPWVMGVENLFTVEFYELVAKNLNHGGVFGQWLHTYSIDNSILEIVIKSIHQVFPYAMLYRVGHGDILVVASPSPLPELSEKKFKNDFVKKFYFSLGVQKADDLYLSQVLSENQFRQVASLSQQRVNSLYFPQLIYRTNKSFFLGTQADIYNFRDKYHIKPKSDTRKQQAFQRLKSQNWLDRCLNLRGFDFLCQEMNENQRVYKTLTTSKNQNQIFRVYLQMRQRNLIPYDPKIIREFTDFSLKNKNRDINNVSGLINELIQVQEYEAVQELVLKFKKAGLLNEDHHKHFKEDFSFAQKVHRDFQP